MAYKTYKVVEGDTLTKIAKKHGTTPQALVRLNDIPGPKMIKPGMEIIVPDNSEHEAVVQAAREAQARSIAAAKEVEEARAAAPEFKTLTHKVAEGETLTKIAKKYGTTPQALVRLNGIAGPKMVKPGMEIVVPDNSEHEAAVKAAKEAQAKSIKEAREKADEQARMIVVTRAAAEKAKKKG